MNPLAIILPMAIAATPPKIATDTCSMAAQTIESMTAYYITSASHSPTGKYGHDKRQQIINQMSQKNVRDIKNFQMKKAALSSFQMNELYREARLFTAYRVRHEYNPCEHLDKKTSQLIYQTQQTIKNQCLNASNPFQKIIINGMQWSSEGFIKEGRVFMNSQCSPNKNTSALFYKHAVANAYDVSTERLCRSAWNGLLAAWDDVKQCTSRGLWYDINAWSKGKLIKVNPPQETKP